MKKIGLLVLLFLGMVISGCVNPFDRDTTNPPEVNSGVTDTGEFYGSGIDTIRGNNCQLVKKESEELNPKLLCNPIENNIDKYDLVIVNDIKKNLDQIEPLEYPGNNGCKDYQITLDKAHYAYRKTDKNSWVTLRQDGKLVSKKYDYVHSFFLSDNNKIVFSAKSADTTYIVKDEIAEKALYTINVFLYYDGNDFFTISTNTDGELYGEGRFIVKNNKEVVKELPSVFYVYASDARLAVIKMGDGEIYNYEGQLILQDLEDRSGYSVSFNQEGTKVLYQYMNPFAPNSSLIKCDIISGKVLNNMYAIHQTGEQKQLNKRYYIANDKVYLDGNVVAGLDTKTATIVSDQTWYIKDASSVFRGPTKIEKADPETFQVIYNSVYAKDKNHVYFNRDILTGADPATFVYEENKETQRREIKDKNHTYDPNGNRID